MLDAKSLEDLASRCPQLSVFNALLQSASAAVPYSQWLLGCKAARLCGRTRRLPRTVMLPVDAAWRKYLNASGISIDELLQPGARRYVQQLLQYHVLGKVLTLQEVPYVTPVADSGPNGSTTGGSSPLLVTTLEGSRLVLYR